MRTAGHIGSGRPSRGRGSAAEGVGFACKWMPGPLGEDPADCHRFVERYPEAFPAGACRSGEGVWLAMGAFRVHGFLFARMWAVRAWNESNGGK